MRIVCFITMHGLKTYSTLFDIFRYFNYEQEKKNPYYFVNQNEFRARTCMLTKRARRVRTQLSVFECVARARVIRQLCFREVSLWGGVGVAGRI